MFALTVIAFGHGAAVAQNVYDFTYSGAGGAVTITNAQIYVDSNNLITNISGGLVDYGGSNLGAISSYTSSNNFVTGINPFFTNGFLNFGTSNGSLLQLYYFGSGENDAYVLQKYECSEFFGCGYSGSPVGSATVTAVPEIDGNALSKALLLLVCFYLMGARWKKHWDERPVPVNAIFGSNAHTYTVVSTRLS